VAVASRPRPLHDPQLVERAKVDRGALEELVAGSRDFLWLVVHRTVRDLPGVCAARALSPEDFFQTAALGLCKAVRAFDASRGLSPMTLAWRAASNEVLYFLRSLHLEQPAPVSLDAPPADWPESDMALGDAMPSAEDVAAGVALSIDLDHALRETLAGFTPGRRKVASRWLAGTAAGLTQREVSRELGVSQSYVSRIGKSVSRGVLARLTA
jgi:RNA polymerase sporulation-specific sigma factor